MFRNCGLFCLMFLIACAAPSGHTCDEVPTPLLDGLALKGTVLDLRGRRIKDADLECLSSPAFNGVTKMYIANTPIGDESAKMAC